MNSQGEMWTLSYRELRARQEPLLARQLGYVAARSTFLTHIWKERGGIVGVPSLDQFESLPLVSKQDLRDALDVGWLGSHLACDPGRVGFVYATSGTSGRPTYFGLTERDLQAWLAVFMRAFYLSGARPGDRVIQGFAMAKGYAGAVPMVRGFESMGCMMLPIGAEAGSARLCDAIERLRPTLLYASPSMVRRLAATYAETYGRPAARASIRKIITGGEPGAGDPASKRELSELWNATVRECGGGSDIIPLMWTECDSQSGLHFVAGDEVLFELIDPKSETVLPPEDGTEGEIVYTHLKREANPLVRMRHGDIVELQVSPCSCGLASPRIRFRGRSDDMLIARGVKVFPSSVQAVVSQFVPPLTGVFAIIRPEGAVIVGALEVICEQETASGGPELQERFERRAREMLGVRVNCRFVPKGELGQEGNQKGHWFMSTASESHTK